MIFRMLYRALRNAAPRLVLLGLLLVTGSSHASLVITTTNQSGVVPFTPTWVPAAGSLVAGLTPSTASGNFSQEASGRNVLTLTGGGSLTLTTITNPGGGTTAGINYVTCGNGGGAGSTIIYTLPAATFGFNLTNITVYSGWQDNGRDAQAYTVSYSTVASPAVFTTLTPVNYNPSVPGGEASANRAILSDSAGGLIASNVLAVKFDFTTPGSENGYCGYGAITIEGSSATNVTGQVIVITTSNQFNSTSFIPTWRIETNNLIAGKSPSTIGPGNFTSESGVAGVSALTDGTFGAVDNKSSYATCGALAGQSLTYAIGGATVAGIVVYTGWPDQNRDGQFYNITYSTAGAPTTFLPLTSVNYNPDATGISASRVAIATLNGTPLATNVAFLKFDFTPQVSSADFGYSGYAEIVVSGVGPPTVDIPTAQPSNNLFVGGSVVLSENAQGLTPFYYQWLTNGAMLPRATNSTLSLTNLTLAASGNYSVVVSNNYGAVTSAPVTLSVTLDTNPPVVLRAFNIGLTNVEVDFSKVVEAATATNRTNYYFTNGLAISGASLATNNSMVLLTTSPLQYGSNYSLVINAVRDRAVPPNTLATNTQVGFTSSPLAPVDIGNPAQPSSNLNSTNGALVTSAGSNIGGNSDQFNFDYQVLSGNFDVSVCLAGLSLSDLWAQAGLMARASLTAGSPFAASIATPGLNGESFLYRAATNGPTASTGSFPVNYPNSWLRLNRVGSVFSGFGSYDGTNWTLLGTASISLPAQIYLGLAVASHNTNQATTARFLNYQTTPTSAVTLTQINPHERLGPSSRKTGIVISEIMYKPAPRADSNNVEFLELYNSNPFFQDISGYQLTCVDMNFTFPAHTLIPGGGFFLLAASPEGIQNVYGLTNNVFGPYNGSLKKTETIQVLDEQGSVLLTVPYSNLAPWPVAADGTGHSIVLANPSYGEEDPRAWDISDTVGGSPGQLESFRPSSLRNVVINEILPHSESSALPQFLELYNHSTNSVDVSGCILTDDPATNRFIIPSGTVMSPGGFVSFSQSQLGFALNGSGGRVCFIKPDGSRILDALQFGPQSDGVSYGRWPDGANDFYALSTRTPGTNNSAVKIGDVVINELMYNPISGNDADQYIELYNQGTNPVNLTGWQFTTGVTFTFPNVTLAPNSYLVVAANLTNLLARYTNLNTANAIGNFGGKLSHSGELVTLSMPQLFYTNTPILVPEDQVSYGTGGRWGEWASGGGSSLELIDPQANHRLAANWADSDESQKSTWLNVETTGVLDNGGNYGSSIDYAQIGPLDVGECLVDNLEVNYNGINYVSNGTFESGLANWSLQGDMVRSSLENSGYGGSSHSLHIRCSDRLWTGVNSCQVALNTNSLSAGQTATLRFKARWIHGWPEVLLRLNGNWLETTAALPVPTNLGTPGGPNSRSIANAGPALYNISHTPALPAANQPAVVTAQVHAPDGLKSLTLSYRVDPATNYLNVVMNDNGTNGDAIAGDGIFSVLIPGQSAKTLVAFYLTATDNRGATTRFPAVRSDDNEPVREGLVLFGDDNPGGSFGVYHLWVTQATSSRWASLSDLSNEAHDCTFVNDSRVIYNMQARFAGSPAHQVFDTPSGNLCHYKWIFNDDEKFLGATSFNKIHQPGNSPGDDPSIQREQLANTFLRTLGVPWLYKRYVAVYVNGNRRGTLMEDTQVPDADVVKQHFPNDAGGTLYKMQPWFEMAPFPSGSSIGAALQSWCCLMPYTTTGGVKKAARYRYMFQTRRTPDSFSNFTNVYSLVDAASSYGTPNYVANMENLANMENWMRVFAANHAAGNFDAYGSQNAQNLYGYIGTLGTKYTLMMWDFNIVVGVPGAGYSTWAPGQNLFVVNGPDTNTQNIYNNPTFRRMYWRALLELVNGPLDTTISGPLMRAKYNAFVANGLSVENPAVNMMTWLTQAKVSIASQLAAVNAAGFTVNPGVTFSNNLAIITGQAPVNVENIWINGSAYPLTWTSLTNWRITFPLMPGTNQLTVAGLGMNAQAIAGNTNSLSLVYNGTNATPTGRLVINEIMHSPVIHNADYIELYNNSTNTAFDLSGYQVQGVGYTFPPGSLIGPTNFLVLAADGPSFAAAYGATIPVFDLFGGHLSSQGESLVLITPANETVTQVSYETRLPWPNLANGTGASLQLIDSRQDNWRAGNWSAQPGSVTPAAPNSVAAILQPFPSLWINEIQADNLNGITNRAGQHVGWVELYNPGTNPVSLKGLYLANTYTNLLQWSFPTNAVMAANEFKIIFADGLTNLSTTNELHASFKLTSGTGSVALTRLATNGQSQVLDYLNYQNIYPNDSYGSLPDGQSFNRQEFFAGTPGGLNNGSATPPASFVDYLTPGWVYTQDFDSLPAQGSTSVNTANPVTINGITYSLANPYDFAYPAIASGAGGLGSSSLAGWYGSGAVLSRFGATDGDQTTGGQISFGMPGNSNRSLGLLATSSTGGTAFGVRFINGTGRNLNRVSVQITGELWRQSNLPKTLQCYYFVDETGTGSFPGTQTATLPGLNVSFPTAPAAVNGVSVDGTLPQNQTHLGVTNQAITNWPAGGALWLVWQMTDSTGKAQGLGIDNLSFYASVPEPVMLGFQTIYGTNLMINWAGVQGQVYQLEFKDSLTTPNWTPVGNPVTGTGGTLTLTNAIDASTQRYFRLRLPE